MAVQYNKLWKILIDKKMSKSALEKKAGISHYAMTMMGKDEDVTTEVLSRICDALECGIDDIVDFIPGRK